MKVLVNERDLEEIRYSRRVGVGKEGICYLPVDDNRIVKLFYDSYKSQVKQVNFSNIKNSQIAFPIDILCTTDGQIVGYTMNYLSGEKFINGFKENLSLSDLKQAYLNLRIIMLKLKNIYMDDNCLDNLLYDYKTNKINIIDTSRWYEKRGGEFESISEFNWQMMTALLTNIDFENYKLNQDRSLSDMYFTYKNSEQLLSIFIEFLNELELKVSEYKGEKVKTIKDLIIK